MVQIPNLPYNPNADWAFFVWPSELNYYMTKYECDTLEGLDNVLFYEYGYSLVIL